MKGEAPSLLFWTKGYITLSSHFVFKWTLEPLVVGSQAWKQLYRCFNRVYLGQATFKIQKVARDGYMYIRSQFLRIYTVFKKAVKMSDFSLSLEDIDLLINCRTGRLMQPTKFYTILFWRSIGAIRNRLLIHGSPFHAVAQFFFGNSLGQSETDSSFTGYVFTQICSFSFPWDKTLCSFIVGNIYPPRRIQTERLTSSTT